MINNIYNYIKNPTEPNNFDKFSLKKHFKIIALVYLLIIPLSFPIIILRVLDLLPKNTIKETADSVGIILYIIILGPIIEELIFRLNLKLSKINTAICSVTIIILLIRLLLYPDISKLFYLSVLPTSAIFYLILYYSKSLYAFLKKLWTQKYKYIFHLSVIVFGVMHLFNYQNIFWWMYLLFPLFVAPYIYLGYILAYTRNKYGFMYALLVHFSINFISAIPAIFLLVV